MIASMINIFILADLLRSDSQLRKSLVLCIRLTLPTAFVAHMVNLLEGTDQDKPSRLPDRSTISRWRLLIDAAFMVCWQRDMARHLAEGGGYLKFVQIDASEQGGRDYEMVVMDVVRQEFLAQICCAMFDLVYLRLVVESTPGVQHYIIAELMKYY